MSTLKPDADPLRPVLFSRFSYRPRTEQWWWSDNTLRIPGFSPGSIRTITELVMRHNRDSVDWVSKASETAGTEQKMFTFMHRLMTGTRAERVILVAGCPTHDANGEAVVSGHVVDISDVCNDEADVGADTSIIDFLAQQSVIEQARGVLMQHYTVDAHVARALLSAFSADTDRSLRDAALLIVTATVVSPASATRRAPLFNTLLERL